MCCLSVRLFVAGGKASCDSAQKQAWQALLVFALAGFALQLRDRTFALLIGLQGRPSIPVRQRGPVDIKRPWWLACVDGVGVSAVAGLLDFDFVLKVLVVRLGVCGVAADHWNPLIHLAVPSARSRRFQRA